MQILGVNKKLIHILGSHFYKIPRFQRSYSWELEQIKAFWDDIVEESSGDYFIGSLVLYKIGEDSRGIVDGQQRLTTFTIMLAALRDCYYDLNFKDESTAIQELIEKRDLRTGKYRFIIETETSYPYFQTQVQTRPDPAKENLSEASTEEELIKNAYSNFVAWFNNKLQNHLHSSGSQKIILDKIRDKMLSIQVIEISLDNEDDAYLVFEILNKRGKELEVCDLVKNHIMRLMPTTNIQIDRPLDRWKKIHQQVETEAGADFNEFIYHMWRSKYGDLPENKLYYAIKNAVTRKNVGKFLEELESDATIYAKILSPEQAEWSRNDHDLKRSFIAISIFKIKMPLPMLLACMGARSEGRMTSKELKQIVKMVEYFHFVYTAICSGRSSGGIQSLYSSIAKKIENCPKGEMSGIRADLKSRLKRLLPDKERFILNFSKLSYSTNNLILKYALSGLHSINEKFNVIDYDQMTLEHIWPRATEGLSIELRNNIGNIILLSEKMNNDFGNQPAGNKIKLLKKNMYPDETVTSIKTWNTKAIKDRSKKIAGLAYDYWQEPFSS